ncbi:hypothetical protein [Actinomadura violacea]|uniref:Uncharacterized protein n=1 Tax=Actinomadura violacea TaxID=2819934 RepID=A0ABS3S989_9ACTN|nr:hypothetical protein [Actinomadura violacea]MBO2465441.1 hypothetical protein [Actinomadura violacea]
MNLPRLTAEHALGPSLGTYATSAARLPDGMTVAPMASLSCLSSCVGPGTAIRCGVQCRADLDCWRRCAGVSQTDCLSACFAT